MSDPTAPVTAYRFGRNGSISLVEYSSRAELDARNAQVREHNARVDAARAAAKTAANIRANKAEVRKARASACPVCFASHPGEC